MSWTSPNYKFFATKLTQYSYPEIMFGKLCLLWIFWIEGVNKLNNYRSLSKVEFRPSEKF